MPIKGNVQSASRFWDRVSRNGSQSVGALGKTGWKTVESSLAWLPRDANVLDFGCGAGMISIELASRVGKIVGIDTSAGMVEQARLNVQRRNVQNAGFLQAELSDGQFQDASFDALLAFNVLHYIEDLPPLFERIQQLLKPGGVFISSTACVRQRRSLMRMLVSIAKKIRLVPQMHFFTSSGLENRLAESGFQIIHTQDLSAMPDRFIVARKRS